MGLTITQTMALVGLVQWGIRQWAVLENQMTSVERIIDYSNSPRETNFESSLGKNNVLYALIANNISNTVH